MQLLAGERAHAPGHPEQPLNVVVGAILVIQQLVKIITVAVAVWVTDVVVPVAFWRLSNIVNDSRSSSILRSSAVNSLIARKSDTGNSVGAERVDNISRNGRYTFTGDPTG